MTQRRTCVLTALVGIQILPWALTSNPWTRRLVGGTSFRSGLRAVAF
jgi:hypothetical protein